MLRERHYCWELKRRRFHIQWVQREVSKNRICSQSSQVPEQKLSFAVTSPRNMANSIHCWKVRFLFVYPVLPQFSSEMGKQRLFVVPTLWNCVFGGNSAGEGKWCRVRRQLITHVHCSRLRRDVQLGFSPHPPTEVDKHQTLSSKQMNFKCWWLGSRDSPTEVIQGSSLFNE